MIISTESDIRPYTTMVWLKTLQNHSTQYDLGRPSIRSPMQFKIISLLTGAIRGINTSRRYRSTWYSFAYPTPACVSMARLQASKGCLCSQVFSSVGILTTGVALVLKPGNLVDLSRKATDPVMAFSLGRVVSCAPWWGSCQLAAQWKFRPLVPTAHSHPPIGVRLPEIVGYLSPYWAPGLQCRPCGDQKWAVWAIILSASRSQTWQLAPDQRCSYG